MLVHTPNYRIEAVQAVTYLFPIFRRNGIYYFVDVILMFSINFLYQFATLCRYPDVTDTPVVTVFQTGNYSPAATELIQQLTRRRRRKSM